MFGDVADPPDSLGRQLGVAIATLRRSTRRAVGAGVEPASIQPAAVELLVLVVESPGIAVSAAADALALAANTVSTLVSVLLRAGLIERGIDGRDRRVAALRPTAQGAARVEQWRAERQRVVDEALATLDARDRRAIEAAMAPLQRLTAALAAPR
jgi:DNA-binding MarR family transcriptional regulator